MKICSFKIRLYKGQPPNAPDEEINPDNLLMEYEESLVFAHNRVRIERGWTKNEPT